jgi:cell division septation protein DedD
MTLSAWPQAMQGCSCKWPLLLRPAPSTVRRRRQLNGAYQCKCASLATEIAAAARHMDPCRPARRSRHTHMHLPHCCYAGSSLYRCRHTKQLSHGRSMALIPLLAVLLLALPASGWAGLPAALVDEEARSSPTVRAPSQAAAPAATSPVDSQAQPRLTATAAAPVAAPQAAVQASPGFKMPQSAYITGECHLGQNCTSIW